MFNKQLYVQESDKLKKNILNKHLEANHRDYLKIPWKPYPAASLAITTMDDNDNNKESTPDTAGTALSVLYASEYVNGHGFYLYSPIDLNQTQNGLCDKNVTAGADDEDQYDYPFRNGDTPSKLIIVSLWVWW